MQISDIISSILGVDNSVRLEAESQLASARAQNPTALLEQLLGAMDTDEKGIGQFACVYIKREFINNTEGVTPEILNILKEKLFEYVKFTRPVAFLQNLGILIVKVYGKTEDYEQLLDKIVEWGKQEDVDARSFSMKLLETLADVQIPTEMFIKYLDHFMSLFEGGLSDKEIKVKVATLLAITSFLTSLSGEEEVKKFLPVMEPMLQTLVETLQSDETAGAKILESLITLVEYHPHIFENHCSQILTIVSEIMKEQGFDNGTRSSALEIINSLAEAYPSMMRKAPEVQEKFFPSLYIMLSHVELSEDSELEEWCNQVEAEDITKSDPHSRAKEGLARFSRAEGEKTTVEATTDIIKNAIQSEDWKFRQAGYYLLGYITESCKKIFGQNLDEIMKMAASGVEDSHPRVKYAGLTCLGLMLSEHSPKAQKKYHAEIMPKLMSIMQNDPVVKIKAQAVSATINFVRDLIVIDENNIEDVRKESDVLKDYTEELLNICGDVLQLSITTTYKPIQEEILALVSCIAQLIDSEFGEYYSKFMPGLISIIETTPNDTTAQKDLKANTIQTIGYLLEAVKERREEFLEDAKKIMQIFVGALSSTAITDDDPQYSSTMQALTQLSAILKDDFLPFLPDIMNKLIKDSQGDVDFKLEDADLMGAAASQTNTDAGLTSMVINMKGLDGTKKLTLNTSALENKIQAVQVIKELANNLGKSFFPYVEPLWAIYKDLFQYKYSKAIRTSVREGTQFLIKACPDEATQSQMIQTVYPVYHECIKSELEKGAWEELMDVINEFLHCVRGTDYRFLPIEDVNTFLGTLTQCFMVAEKEKLVQIQQFKDDGHLVDEEDQLVLDEQIDEIQKIETNIMI